MPKKLILALTEHEEEESDGQDDVDDGLAHDLTHVVDAGPSLDHNFLLNSLLSLSYMITGLTFLASTATSDIIQSSHGHTHKLKAFC